MAPKAKEEEKVVGDGREAEDKGKHKGDWGSHSHADHEAEQAEPTEAQLKQAQAIINSQWIQPE